MVSCRVMVFSLRGCEPSLSRGVRQIHRPNGRWYAVEAQWATLLPQKRHLDYSSYSFLPLNICFVEPQ